MTEIKGIDVSRWNGNIDWKTVANYGMGFAILRITEKGNIVDSTFEPNYKGCIENKIPVGVYKYSYATTIAQIENEANIVIKTLNKRKLNYPVFLDIEDKCQENLSDSLMMKMIEAFRTIIIKAGYKFGIYCGYSWYQNQLPGGAKKYDVWTARYPNNDTGELQERLRVPASTDVVGWQYSSKATIPGISTKVDRSVFYKDYSKSSSTSNQFPNNSQQNTNFQGGNNMSILISNCGHDENGRYSGGKAGDQTGTEWYIRDWYRYPSGWDCVLRLKNATYRKKNAELATRAAKNDLIGYDQYQRDTYWQHLKASNYDPSQITIACEADCSSGIVAHMKAIGYLYNNSTLKNCSATYTGNMRNWARNSGLFDILTDNKYINGSDYLMEGDILLNETHHVCTVVSNGRYAQSSTPSTPTSTTTYNKWVGAATKDGTDVFANPTGILKLSTYPKLNKGNLVDVIGVSGTRYQVKIADQFVGYVEKTNIKDPNAVNTKPVTSTNTSANKPASKTKYPFVGEVIASELNVRTGAGTNYGKLSSYPILKKTNLVDVLKAKKDVSGDKWYQVRIAGKYTGYVSAKYIKKK